MEVGFETNLFAWFGFKTQLGVVHVLPGKKVHVAIVCVVRWKEILEGFNVAIGGIVVAAGVVVLRKEARTPGTFEIVTSSDMRSESGKIEIAHLARLKGKLSLTFPAMQLFRISFHFGLLKQIRIVERIIDDINDS